MYQKNQTEGSYWSSNVPVVHCPKCKEKMSMLLKSTDLSLFYRCFEDCKREGKISTRDFESAKNQVLHKINQEISSKREEHENESI